MEVRDILLTCTHAVQQIPYERHFHNTHEMIFVCSGAAHFRIGDAGYDAGPGSLLFISRLEEHAVRILSGPYTRYFLQLTPVQLDRLLDDPLLKTVFTRRPAAFCHQFDMSASIRRMEDLFRQLTAEFSQPGPYAALFQASLFRQILILVYRAKSAQFPPTARAVSPAVIEAQRFLDTHCTEPLSIEEVAQRFYLSTSYLSHAFREWTGYSPKQYIMLSRLSLARELLLTTDLSVAEVAVHCGFGDTNNFIRSFKRETGRTPLRYRQGKDHDADKP